MGRPPSGFQDATKRVPTDAWPSGAFFRKMRVRGCGAKRHPHIVTGMTASMTGLVNYAKDPYSVELREVPVPDIGEEDVLLAVQAVGVCGTDVHVYLSLIHISEPTRRS